MIKELFHDLGVLCLLIQIAHEALTEARVLLPLQANASNSYAPSKNESVGVFVGLSNTDWAAVSDANSYTTMGTAHAAAANRISYTYGFSGPSIVVDTACSSSMASIHTACNALQMKDCNVAFVGAADLLVSSTSIDVSSKI